MKAFFLSGSIFFTVMILIVAFENLGATMTNFLFLFAGVASPFLIVMGLCILGIIAGIFYTGLVTALLRSGRDEEEAPGNEW